jgi:Xaa-Pro aminopeptidase
MTERDAAISTAIAAGPDSDTAASEAAAKADRLYPTFSPAEFARRYAAARALMARQGADVLVVYGNSSIARHNHADVHYLTGFLGNRNNYAVLPAQGDPVLFVQSFNHVPNAREVSAVEVRWGGVSSAASVAAHVRALHAGRGTLAYAGDLPVQTYLRWQRDLEGWRFLDVSDTFEGLRLRKSAEELAWLRRGAALTDAALRAAAEAVRPGLREYQVGAVIEASALNAGGLPHLYYLSSASQDAAEPGGPAACVPRQNLSSRIIGRGDVINTEISVSYWGYSGQIHRPIFVETPPGPLYRRLWDTALDAYTHAVEALRPGATSEDVLDAADRIHAQGFTINDGFLHGFGIGLLPPSLRTRRTMHEPHAPFVFEAGMCVVVQPNVVTEDERAGVQLGNLLHITETGCECLQHVPLQYFVTPARA